MHPSLGSGHRNSIREAFVTVGRLKQPIIFGKDIEVKNMQKEQQDFEIFIKSKPVRSSALPTSPKQQLLPLDSLDWKTFEILCCRLIRLDAEIDHAYLYGVPGDDQKGIDIVAEKKVGNGFQTWCYQCKNYKKISSVQLKKAIEAIEFQADRYVFCITSMATERLRKVANDYNVDLWDAQDISFKLKDHPELVADFFHPVWEEVFCVTKKKSSFSILATYAPPQPNGLFIGRDAELKNLYEHWGKQRVIIVEGIGGIGKTQLVLQALRNIDDTSTVWLDVESCRGISDLQQLLFSVFSHQNSPVETEQALLDFLSRQALCLVFDGLDRIALSQWDQVTDFLSKLVRFTKYPKFVITTQIEFNNLDFDTFRLTLRPLTIKDSAQLLNSTDELASLIESDKANFGWLLHFCDGHPLSLRLVLGLIRYYKDIKVVVSRLQASSTKELKDPIRNRQLSSTSLHVCLAAVYEHFDHQQKRLLQYISCFPAGCIEFYAKNWQDAETYETNLAELKRLLFVELRDDPMRNFRRFHLLNPVRHFVRSKWKADAPNEAMEIQIAASQYMMVKAMHITLTHLDPNLSYINLIATDLDLPNYRAAMNYAIAGARAKKKENKDVQTCLEIILFLATGLMQYFFIRVFLHFGVSSIQAGIDAGEQLGDDCLDEVLNLYDALFALKQRRHDDTDQDTILRRHEAIIQRVLDNQAKTSPNQTEALAWQHRGNLARENGQYAEAIRYYQVAEDHFRRILEEAKRNNSGKDEKKLQSLNYIQGTLSSIIGDLGRVYEAQNSYQQAIAYYIESLTLLKETENTFNCGCAYHHLGNCYTGIGEIVNAIDCYKKSVEIFASIEYGQYLSNSMGEIGDIIVDTGINFSGLREFFSEELIMLGLKDVGSEVEHLLSHWEINAFHNKSISPVELVLLRKLFAIIKLVSFTEHTPILATWAGRIEEEFAVQLIVALEEKLSLMSKKELAESPEFIQMYAFMRDINLVLLIALSIPKILQEEKEQKEGIAEIYVYCNQLLYQIKAWEWFSSFTSYYNLHFDAEALQHLLEIGED